MWRVLVVLGVFACSKPPTLSYAARYQALRTVEDVSFTLPARARRALVLMSYRALFASELPARAADLPLRLKAASVATATSLEPALLSEMRTTFAALELRGLATDDAALWLSQALIACRLLDEARALAVRYPALEPVPQIRTAADWVAGQPSAWRFDAAGNLERHRIDLHAAQVILVSSPNCHFSNDALAAIFADATLAPIFAAHATLIIPPSFQLEAAGARAWNRAHPEQPMAIAVDERDWPMVDVWGTPNFFFIRDGAVVANVRGWQSDAQKANVRAALAAIGLYDSRSR